MVKQKLERHKNFLSVKEEISFHTLLRYKKRFLFEQL